MEMSLLISPCDLWKKKKNIKNVYMHVRDFSMYFNIIYVWLQSCRLSTEKVQNNHN